MNNTPVEDRELLYRDLCARMPYGVKVQLMNAPAFGDAEPIFSPQNLSSYKLDIMGVWADGSNLSRLYKPYLFPLSSLTEEQWSDYLETKRLAVTERFKEIIWEEMDKEEPHVTLKSITCDTISVNWMLEHHFDVYGLIEKDLAFDATGKNIY